MTISKNSNRVFSKRVSSKIKLQSRFPSGIFKKEKKKTFEVFLEVIKNF